MSEEKGYDVPDSEIQGGSTNKVVDTFEEKLARQKEIEKLRHELHDFRGPHGERLSYTERVAFLNGQIEDPRVKYTQPNNHLRIDNTPTRQSAASEPSSAATDQSSPDTNKKKDNPPIIRKTGVHESHHSGLSGIYNPDDPTKNNIYKQLPNSALGDLQKLDEEGRIAKQRAEEAAEAERKKNYKPSDALTAKLKALLENHSKVSKRPVTLTSYKQAKRGSNVVDFPKPAEKPQIS